MLRACRRMRNRRWRRHRHRRGAAAGAASAAGTARDCPPTRPSSPTGRTTAAASGTSCLRAQNGHATVADIAAFFAACPPPKTNCPNAPRPKHSSKELQMYGDLVYASPGPERRRHPQVLQGRHLRREAERGRADLLAARPRRRDDRARRQLRRPAHLRQDARRHDVRARLRGRRGPPLRDGRAPPRGARRSCPPSPAARAGNRAQDHTQWELAPYTEADLQRQYDLGDEVYGAAGAALQDDVTNYVAGINRYITEARLNPLKMPGEYAAIGKPGPAGLEGHGRDRHGEPDRRDLRQGRRPRARLRAAAPGRAEALRAQARQARVGGPPHAPRTPRRR